jgi:TetR/AcrR family transcriptional repressor of nem operon
MVRRSTVAVTSRENTKVALLDAGRRIFCEKGYSNAGLEAILQAAGVPKGSFYYYFQSKEDFGLQVIDRFAECFAGEFERITRDESVSSSPRERLRRFYEAISTKLGSQECRHGCLVGNLSQEMADQSEGLRARLAEVFADWRDRHADCLRQAQVAGELPSSLDVEALAEFWVSAWQGAILRAKTMRSQAPLRAFLDVMFGVVLQPEPSAERTV